MDLHADQKVLLKPYKVSTCKNQIGKEEGDNLLAEAILASTLLEMQRCLSLKR